MVQFGAVGCWAVALCGAFLGDVLGEAERAALGGGREVVGPLLLPLFSEVSKAREKQRLLPDECPLPLLLPPAAHHCTREGMQKARLTKRGLRLRRCSRSRCGRSSASASRCTGLCSSWSASRSSVCDADSKQLAAAAACVGGLKAECQKGRFAGCLTGRGRCARRRLPLPGFPS